MSTPRSHSPHTAVRDRFTISTGDGTVAISREHLPVVVSTLDHAHGRIASGESPWFIVTADRQTGGRGTHGRTWVSVPGQVLIMSMAVPPPGDYAPVETLTLRTAAHLRDAVTACADLTCTIKPPNDLLAGGRKLAGILFETSSTGTVRTPPVLGMGVNIGQTREVLNTAGLSGATSISAETGKTPSPDSLLEEFLARFVPDYCATFLSRPGGMT